MTAAKELCSEAATRSSVNTTKSSRSIKLQCSYALKYHTKKIHNTAGMTVLKLVEDCSSSCDVFKLSEMQQKSCSKTNVSFIVKLKYLATSLKSFDCMQTTLCCAKPRHEMTTSATQPRPLTHVLTLKKLIFHSVVYILTTSSSAFIKTSYFNIGKRMNVSLGSENTEKYGCTEIFCVEFSY